MAGNSRSGTPLTTADHLVLLVAIADGHSDADIAALWGIPVDTVKWRVKQLYRWLDAKNRAHAVAVGFQRDLLPHDEQAARTA